MMHKHQTVNQILLLKKQARSLNLFWLGFLIYSVGSILGVSKYVNIKACEAFQVLGLISIVAGSVYLIQAKIMNRYLKVIFTVYMIWLLIIIIRGIQFNYTFAKDFLFGDGNGGLKYFVPLILVFPSNFVFYRKIFDVIIVAAIFYLALDAVFVRNLISSGRDPLAQRMVESVAEIGIPAGFILLTYRYHSFMRYLFALGIIMVTLLFTVIRARRGLIFITSSILIFSYLLYLVNSNRKFLVIYLSILLMSLGALYVSNLYKINNAKLFGFLANRRDEDSRTGVELYFYDDMKPRDWIIGKGMTGQYFCPNIEEDQLTNFRNIIETGYLQLILKGGLVSLGLLLMITMPAFMKGLFYSKNILSKGCGIWIFSFMINLYPQNAVAFNLSYLLVWVSIGICFSKRIRNMSNDEIKNWILSVNKESHNLNN